MHEYFRVTLVLRSHANKHSQSVIVTGAPPTIFRTPAGGYSKFAIRKIFGPERKPSLRCAGSSRIDKSGRPTVMCIRGWMTKMAVSDAASPMDGRAKDAFSGCGQEGAAPPLRRRD